MKYDAWVAKAAKQPIVLETVDFGPLGADDVEVADPVDDSNRLRSRTSLR